MGIAWWPICRQIDLTLGGSAGKAGGDRLELFICRSPCVCLLLFLCAIVAPIKPQGLVFSS